MRGVLALPYNYGIVEMLGRRFEPFRLAAVGGGHVPSISLPLKTSGYFKVAAFGFPEMMNEL